jgi:hypothetical protein
MFFLSFQQVKKHVFYGESSFKKVSLFLNHFISFMRVSKYLQLTLSNTLV